MAEVGARLTEFATNPEDTSLPSGRTEERGRAEAKPKLQKSLQELLAMQGPSRAVPKDRQAAPDITKPLAQQYERQAEIQPQYERAKTERQAEAITGEQGRLTGRVAELQGQMKEVPEFKMPERDTLSFMATFMALPIMAMMSGGKRAIGQAQSAQAAMTGMLKGYQEGDKAAFEREKAVYDKNVAAIKANNDRIKSLIETEMRLAPGNLQAATARAAAELAALGAEVTANQLRTEGLQKVYDAIVKQNAQINQQIQQQTEANRRTEQQLEQQRQRQEQLRIQEERLRLEREKAEKTAQGRDLRPSAKISENFTSQIGMLSDIDDLSKQLQDPAFRKKLNDTRAMRYITQEISPTISQATQARLPEDVAGFLVRLQAFRNAYYLAISGKAITGGEAQRNYNVVPQPADTPERLDTKLATMKKYLNDSVQIYEKTYPQLGRVRGLVGDTQQAAPAPGGVIETENRKKARDAISRGGNRDEILKRLREAGEDISGL